MRALLNVAVFGLLPVPSLAAIGHDRASTSNQGRAAQRARPTPGITERMATKDELARIHRELGHVNAESAEATP